MHPTLKEKEWPCLELFGTNPEEERGGLFLRDNLDTNQYFEVTAVIIDENIWNELTLELKKYLRPGVLVLYAIFRLTDVPAMEVDAGSTCFLI